MKEPKPSPSVVGAWDEIVRLDKELISQKENSQKEILSLQARIQFLEERIAILGQRIMDAEVKVSQVKGSMEDLLP